MNSITGVVLTVFMLLGGASVNSNRQEKGSICVTDGWLYLHLPRAAQNGLSSRARFLDTIVVEVGADKYAFIDSRAVRSAVVGGSETPQTGGTSSNVDSSRVEFVIPTRDIGISPGQRLNDGQLMRPRLAALIYRPDAKVFVEMRRPLPKGGESETILVELVPHLTVEEMNASRHERPTHEKVQSGTIPSGNPRQSPESPSPTEPGPGPK